LLVGINNISIKGLNNYHHNFSDKILDWNCLLQCEVSFIFIIDCLQVADSLCLIVVFYSYWFQYNICCCFYHTSFVICFVMLFFYWPQSYCFFFICWFYLLLFSFDGNFRRHSTVFLTWCVTIFFFLCNNIYGYH
jgi:hypothetical protein